MHWGLVVSEPVHIGAVFVSYGLLTTASGAQTGQWLPPVTEMHYVYRNLLGTD